MKRVAQIMTVHCYPDSHAVSVTVAHTLFMVFGRDHSIFLETIKRGKLNTLNGPRMIILRLYETHGGHTYDCLQINVPSVTAACVMNLLEDARTLTDYRRVGQRTWEPVAVVVVAAACSTYDWSCDNRSHDNDTTTTMSDDDDRQNNSNNNDNDQDRRSLITDHDQQRGAVQAAAVAVWCRQQWHSSGGSWSSLLGQKVSTDVS